MAYNLKYYNEFKNYYNETIRIEILGLDFAGNSTEVKTMATPLVISYPGEDQKAYNPIIGSQATINLLSESNFQFIDLHNSDARAHRVDIYKSGSLFWIGWVLPDLFSEPYVAPPYPVSITARCGLGELKEIQMPATINRLKRGESVPLVDTDIPDLYSIIAGYLATIETSLILNVAISVYSDENDSINDSSLANTHIYLKAYKDKTAYDAISDILLTFGARLYQMDGQWWIVRIKELGNTLSIQQWTISLTGDNTFSTDETQLKTFKVGRPEGSQIVNEGPNLDLLPAWKKFNWVQDLKLKDNILRNGDFTQWNIPNRRQIDGTTSGGNVTIKNWIEWIPGLVSRRVDASGNVYTQWNHKTDEYINIFQQDTFEGNYIFQNVAPIEISVNQDVKVLIEYDNVRYDTQTNSDRFLFELKTIGGGVTKYLQYDENTTEYSWTTTPTRITYSGLVPTNYGATRTRYSQEKFNWRTLEFLAPGFENPSSLGAFEFKIYGCFGSYLRLRKVRIVMVDSDDFEYENEITTEVIVNENNVYTPEDIEIVGGDLPDVTNAEIIWDGGYRKLDYQATSDWHERGSALEYPLLELIGKDYQSVYITPQFKLTVPILSQTVKFDSCIVDYLVLPKKYICMSAEIDMQTCIFSGIYSEFNVWEDADWILDDGTWNDDGIWVDTDEYWNEIVIESPGDHDITYLFQTGDTIDSLPENSPGVGGILKEDGFEIVSVPHVLNAFQIEFRPNAFIVASSECTFDATISGESRKIKIVIRY